VARYIIEVAGTYGGLRYEKGQVAELTSAQVSTIGAGNLRAAVNPVISTSTTAYAGGGTSSVAVQAGTPTHDTAGEATGVSNSA
jgi:hypothetical protein